MTKIVARHLILSMLPLAVGVVAGFVFARQQHGCGSLVGPLFAAKCGRVLVQYQLRFQTLGTAGGGLVAALLGIWLERRRTKRAARAAATIAEPPTTDG